MAIDSTVGGASANSYVSQTAASAYFANRLDDDEWTEAISADRDRALMMATARLEAEPWVGSPVTITQRLAWPRYGVTDRNGVLFSTTAIPQPIQDATFELALEILKDPTIAGGGTGLGEFEQLSIGSLSITPRVGGMAGWALPAILLRLLGPWLLSGGQHVHVVRG